MPSASPVNWRYQGNCARSKECYRLALEAKRRHRQTLIVRADNAAEAAAVEGVEVYGAGSLSEVVHFLRGDISLEPVRSNNSWSETGSGEQELDFGQVGACGTFLTRLVKNKGYPVTERFQHNHKKVYTIRLEQEGGH
jgi:hypothetical protein